MGRIRSDSEAELNEAVPGVSLLASARVVGLLALVITGAALACRVVPDDSAATAAVKLVTATLAVGVVPGALVTLLSRPRAQLTLLEVIGFGIAISFGMVHFEAILAISLHADAAISLGMLAAGSTLMAVQVMRRRAAPVTITLDELIVCSLLVVLGALLYGLGSPVTWWEDQVHVAIVRRLSALASPRLDNLYVTPGIVYAYPIPGTHYFMALIARLGDLDALFVYHKLRFFWGPAALVILHLAARTVFGTRGIAAAVTVTVTVLVCNGAFAMVPGFDSGWGQLATYSHVSDVGMNVLLPALLIAAFGYLTGAKTRERAFFLVAAVVLVVTVAMVHIRELVQFAVYTGCFLLVAATIGRFRAYARRAALLFAIVIAVATAYTLWQARVSGLVGDIVQTHRATLSSIVATSSVRTLVSTPAAVLLPDFLINSDQLSAGLTPLFLFTGPAVAVLFSRQPLAWLATSGTLLYLAVMTMSLLAIPYIYFTYFEILYTPVRNIIFFVYLFSGAAIYAAAAGVARAARMRLAPFAAGTFAGVVALLITVCLNRSAAGFAAPLIIAYGVGVMCAWAAPVRATAARAAMAALAAVLGLVLLFPERSAVERVNTVSVRWTAGLPDAERASLERQFSLSAGEPNSNYSSEVNVWNYTLDDPSPENIRALVNHPQVVDTNDIDRTRFTVTSQPPDDEHQYLGITYLARLHYPGLSLFIATTVFVWALGFAAPWLLASARGSAVVAAFSQTIGEPFYRRAVPYALFVVPFAVLTARPTLSPVTASPAIPGQPATPSAVIERLPCVTTRPAARFGAVDAAVGERTTCPPPPDLVEWIRNNVPVEAVFAVDRWTAYAPQMFMPQQAVSFPALDATFLQEDRLFSTYYRFFDERMERNQVQPFFNAVETAAERMAFVEALGVTHVLVNPPYHREMRTVLDAMPDRFTSRYDRAEWAIYEVRRNQVSTRVVEVDRLIASRLR